MMIHLTRSSNWPWRRFIRGVIYRQMIRHRSFIDIRDEDRYELLREHGHIHRLDQDAIWLVTGFDLADRIVRENNGFVKVRQTEKLDRYNMFQLAEPKAHERMQRFLMATFSKEILLSDAAFISRLSTSLFDELPFAQPFDLHRRFCIPISYRAVCRILGIADTAAAKAFQTYAPVHLDLTFPDHFEGWLRALIVAPPSGEEARLINVLRHAVLNGEYTPDQAFELLNIVWNGFLGTMPIMLSLIFEHVTTRGLSPDTEDVSEDSWLLRLADEVVRMHPVILKIIRRATRDADLDGVKIKEGDKLLIDLRIINRDASQFRAPEVFSIEENRQRHLSFGAGAHRCLGMQMARHSARFILSPLIVRFQSLRFLQSAWLDMETPLTFIHYPEHSRYQIFGQRKN